MQKKLLKIPDVLEIIPVTEETVRNWIRQKKLRATRIGRDYFIDPDDLRDFLDKRSTIPGGEIEGEEQ